MTRKHTLPALLATLALSLPSLRAAGPPNDSFANRILLVGTNIVTAGTTRSATWEPWESSLGIPPSSVWWSWTAPTDGIVAIETVGASAPVRLSVLEGATPQELTGLAGLRRWLYPAPRLSQIAFPAFQGLSCAIVASVEDAVAGGESDFTLALTVWPRPANDAFANRFVLTGNEVTERVFVVGATPENWERARPDWYPDLGEGSGPATAWWEWQAPSSGPVTVSFADDVSQLGGQAGGVSSQAALRMTVLTGRDPAQFSLVGQASSWAPPYLATTTFDAVAGTTYQLALTAPADGRVLITTDADRASAGLYQGSSLGSLTRLAASPVDAARQLVAPVVAGATYYLTIESDARWPGTFSLDLLLLPDPQGTLAASIGEDGAFSIQGFGFPAVVRVLEMSTDLRAWVPVQTSAAGGVNFREPIERTVPHRFYRVVTRSGP